VWTEKIGVEKEKGAFQRIVGSGFLEKGRMEIYAKLRRI
jgi:hypothetical protein